LNTFVNIFKLLNSVGIPVIWDLVRRESRRRILSNETQVIFCYDLSADIEIPEPDIPLTFRPLTKDDDISEILVRHSGVLCSMELKTRIECLLFIRSGIPTCYVGIAENEKPVVINWMIKYDMNEKIQQYFKGGIQPLKPDEVLCEFVFTHQDFRGLRLHTWSTLKMFEEAKGFGAAKAIAYVPIKNETSFYVTEKFGWKPFMKKIVYRRMSKRKITFSPYIEV
jgi:hypothetical protein